MLTIITAIFGGYDAPKEPVAQTIPCRFVLVTDGQLEMASDSAWDPVIDQRFADLHPRLQAKRPKLFPWEYTDDRESVWIDGSLAITSSTFALDMWTRRTEFATFKHPVRDCIYDEVFASLAHPDKYGDQPIEDQARAYLAEGHPHHWGLWETSIIRRGHSPANITASEAWWDEMLRWTYQDQISYPVICRRLGLAPATLPGRCLANPWTTYAHHLRED